MKVFGNNGCWIGDRDIAETALDYEAGSGKFGGSMRANEESNVLTSFQEPAPEIAADTPRTQQLKSASCFTSFVPNSGRGNVRSTQFRSRETATTSRS
jgi:hypothetical protein